MRAARSKAVKEFLENKALSKLSIAVDSIENLGFNLQLESKPRVQLDGDTRQSALSAALELQKHGDIQGAIRLLGGAGYIEELNDLLTQKITTKDTELIELCITYYKIDNKHANFEIEALRKLGDHGRLVSVYIKTERWSDAFQIADLRPEYYSRVYLNYANYLSMRDRYGEAREYYEKAGRRDEAIRVLKILASSFTTQHRFKHASYYYWNVGREISISIREMDENVCHNNTTNVKLRAKLFKDSLRYNEISRIYYAYSQVYRYVNDPFTFSLPETLLNTSKFVLRWIENNDHLDRVSIVYTLYCIAKISHGLRCYGVCRAAYEKLRLFVLPNDWRDTIDLATVMIRAKPNTNPDEFNSICYQCGYIDGPMYSDRAACTSCLEPYIFSFYSFTRLPLIQFVFEEGVGEEEGAVLIGKYTYHSIDRPRHLHRSLDSNIGKVSGYVDEKQQFYPMVLSRQQLLDCQPESVFIRNYPNRIIKKEYYLLVMDDYYVIKCDFCQEFFVEEEWEYQILVDGCCPFCKSKPNQNA